MKWPSARFARFLVVGGVNTVLGYALYLAFERLLDYRWAYTLSYALGIAISYVLNARFVFRQPLSWRRMLAFPAVYVVQYAAGIVLLWLLVERLGLPREIAPLAVVAATIPLTYATSRLVLTRRPP